MFCCCDACMSTRSLRHVLLLGKQHRGFHQEPAPQCGGHEGLAAEAIVWWEAKSNEVYSAPLAVARAEPAPTIHPLQT